MLKKWRYPTALVVAVGIGFPALAMAASPQTGTKPAQKHRQAEVSKAAKPLTRPARQLRASIDIGVHRIRVEQRRKHKQRFSHLPGGVSLSTLNSIAQCESGGDPHAVSAGGTYRGKYQFDYGTWASVGGHGDPAAAPEREQDYRAALLYTRSGSSPWPVCG